MALSANQIDEIKSMKVGSLLLSPCAASPNLALPNNQSTYRPAPTVYQGNVFPLLDLLKLKHITCTTQGFFIKAIQNLAATANVFLCVIEYKIMVIKGIS